MWGILIVAKVNDSLMPAGTPVWMWGALILTIIGVIHGMWERHQLLTILEEQQRQLTLQAEANNAEPVVATQVEVNPKAEQAVKGISHALNVPWLQLMDAIQRAAGSEVTLGRIQPDAGTARIQVEGQTASVGSVFAYIKRLQGQGMFSKVVPVSVEPVAGGIVRFKIAATWSSAP